MRLTIVALLACCWAAPALAADFQVPPTPNHYVTDNAGALSSGTRATLESELQTYEKSTGHQILVWIGQTTGDVPLETWTVETVNKWKVGRRAYDDGAVLFLFMQDHKIRIEVGYGLEGSLTDADSDRIIRHVITPGMRSSEVDGAISSGVAAMLATISPSYKGVTPPPETSETGNLTSPAGVTILAVLGLGFGFLLLMVILQGIWFRRHGYVVTRHGPSFWGPGGFIGGGFGGGGFGGGGFSAGGGSFGGGGASGGW